MASKLKLLNSEGTTLTVSNSDLLLQDKDVIYLDTVEQLTNASGSNGDVAHVSDLDRGGVFIYDSTSTDNQGTVFGSWVRQYDGAVNVKWFGAVGDGITDDTVAIQNALDYIRNVEYKESGKLEFTIKAKYLISKPLLIGGANLLLDGNNCTVIKNTDDVPTDTLPSIAVTGGNIDPNQNAIFLTDSNLRYSTIQNFTLEGVASVSAPIGIWGTGDQNIFRNIYMWNTSIGIQVKSMWLSTLSHIMVRSPSSHGIYFDRNRLDGNIGQSGTSIHFDNCYVSGAGGKGFYLQDLDYSTFSACACDFSTEESYWFQGCSAVNGSIAFENRTEGATTSSIVFRETSGAISIDSYDENEIDAPIIDAIDSVISISGRIRTAYTSYMSASLNSNVTATSLFIDPIDGSYDSSKFTSDSTSWIQLFSGTLLVDKGYIKASRESNPSGIFDRLIDDGDIVSLRKDGNVVGSLRSRSGVVSTLILDPRDGVSTGAGISATGRAILPADNVSIVDNYTALGASSHRWSTVYAATGTINTSDDREKTYLTINEKETLVAKELKGLIKKFKFNDAIEAKGEDNARIHFGTSAQSVISVFESHELDPMKYAMICYDEWEEEVDEDGNVTLEAGNRYGIRYEELIMFIIGGL